MASLEVIVVPITAKEVGGIHLKNMVSCNPFVNGKRKNNDLLERKKKNLIEREREERRGGKKERNVLQRRKEVKRKERKCNTGRKRKIEMLKSGMNGV